MSSKSLGAAVLGIAAIGATVYFGGNYIKNRPYASLKEKDRQTAEKIKKLVEDEGEDSEVAGESHGKRGKVIPVAGITSTAGSFAAVDEGATNGKFCGTAEYFGAGPEQTQLDPTLWNQFMGDYHAAKTDLIQFVSANKSYFSESFITAMENEIRGARVMRPQNQIEPDLTWRGIAAWTRPRAGAVENGERPSLIHVGSGFMQLFQKNRARARFEIARLLAQSWSPCELTETRDSKVWKDFFSCMGLEKSQTECKPGVVSEASWAMSTAVASLVSQPGCQIQAFADDKSAACLKVFHRGDVASYELEVPNRKVASSAAHSEN
jgi:hypothetical protein